MVRFAPAMAMVAMLMGVAAAPTRFATVVVLRHGDRSTGLVVDAEGKPLQVYHGTKFDGDISIFLPMTHFGTARAAGQRINHKEQFIPEVKASGERPAKTRLLFGRLTHSSASLSP